MKPSVNKTGSAITKVLSKREGKKQINIAWNPRIVFQLGLIAVLLLVFFVMNITIDVPPSQPASEGWVFEEPPLQPYQIEKEVPKFKAKIQPASQPLAKTNPRVVQKVVHVVPNDTPDLPDDNPLSTEMPTGATLPGATQTTSSATTEVVNTMKTVEFVPIFPGCADLHGNNARQDCMSEKIGAFIVRKFRTDKFDGDEFAGKQRIYVQFTIDRFGVVTDVKANAAHEFLKEEALRVVRTLPEMIPGMQGNSPVPVRYRIPIVFQFQ